MFKRKKFLSSCTHLNYFLKGWRAMLKYRLNWLFFIVILLSGCVQANGNFPAIKSDLSANGSSEENIMKFQLSELFDERPQIEFSERDNYILCWTHYPKMPGDYNKIPVKYVIFSYGDKIVPIVTNEQSEVDQYFDMFKAVTYRNVWQFFIAPAYSWGFSNDWKYGARLFTTNKTLTSMCKSEMEMWDLSGNAKMLWETKNVPAVIGGFDNIFLFKSNSNNYILLCTGNKAFIMDQKDGHIYNSFNYESNFTKQIPKQGSDDDMLNSDDNIFWASRIVFNPINGLLALGDLNSKRVRIFKLYNKGDIIKFEMVIEYNTKLNSFFKGGFWNIGSLKFSPIGDYLIVEYNYGGSFGRDSYYTYEIFDNNVLKSCWESNDPSVCNVNISRDEKTMAYIQDMFLMVQPFLHN